MDSSRVENIPDAVMGEWRNRWYPLYWTWSSSQLICSVRAKVLLLYSGISRTLLLFQNICQSILWSDSSMLFSHMCSQTKGEAHIITITFWFQVSGLLQFMIWWVEIDVYAWRQKNVNVKTVLLTLSMAVAVCVSAATCTSNKAKYETGKLMSGLYLS